MKNGKIDFGKLKKESMDSVSPIERREFLRVGLIITGVFAGGTVLSVLSNFNKVFASPEEAAEKYPYKPHYAMVLRQDRCIDCERCLEACRITNDVPSYGYRTRIFEKDVPDAIGRTREFIPVLCNQCNNPPCVRACPTRATIKDEKTGIVLMISRKCIGCKTCMLACPYNARYFNDERGAIDKCNFCYDTRLSKGEKLTACAAACPAGVRNFGDLSDPGSEVYKMVHQLDKVVWVIRPDAAAKPNVFYTKG